jgi:hypothetical protein
MSTKNVYSGTLKVFCIVFPDLFCVIWEEYYKSTRGQKMKTRKILIFTIAAVAIAAVSIFTVIVKENDIRAVADTDARLARCDLADAAAEMSDTASLIYKQEGDVIKFAQSAGAAQAYMSRARLDGCQNAYAFIDALIERARSGEDVRKACKDFANAVSKAEKDGGEALRGLLASPTVSDMILQEQSTRTDFLRLRSMGDGGLANAERTASRFACKNCELSICENNTFPPSYVFAGENVYISLTYDGERVLEYCFDRDVDLTRDIGEGSARAIALSVVEGQRLGKLREAEATRLNNGIYRFCWSDASFSHELAVAEIYADTGRLRRFCAIEYYKGG